MIPVTGASTETVGDVLRRNREERGLSLADVSRETRIPQRHLLALEEGHHERLPSLTYAVGFIRSYAKALGLVSDPLIVQFKDETALTSTPQPQISPDLPVEARQPGLGWIIGGAVALVVLLGGGYWLMQSGATTTVAPAVDPATESLAQAEPVPQPQPAAPVLSDTAAPPLAGPPPEPLAADVSADSAAVPGATAPLAADAGVPGAASGTEPVPGLVVPPPAALPAGATAVPGVVIRAVEDSWIRVSDGSPRALAQRVLKAGETYTVPDVPGVTLTTGNAGGVVILVDGRARPSLGAKGQIVRNVPLSR